jgi:hypothetical protein
MENVALQSQLQAISLGASLAQRRIENERIRQQLQMRAADQVIQNQQAALQMKMQETQLASTLREQEAMNAEFGTFNELQQGIADFLNSGGENVPLPKVPVFKSKTYQAEALKAISGLEQYSTRAKLSAARSNYEKSRVNTVADLLNLGIDVTDPRTGQINEQLYQQSIPKLAEFKQTQQLPQEIREELVQIDENIPYPERVKKARELADQRRSNLPTAVMRNVKSLVDNRVKLAELNGAPLSEEEIEKVRKSAIEAGGKLRPLDAALSKKLEGDFAALESVDYLLGEIKQFEAETKQPFSSFLGVVPAKRQEIESRFSEEKDSVKRRALGILSDFYGALNEAGRTKSGLTVTEGERLRLELEIGSKFDKNTLIKLQSYRNRLDRDVRRVIRSNMDRDLNDWAESFASTEPGTSSFEFNKQNAPAATVTPAGTNSAQQEKVFEFDASGTFLK